MTICYVSDAELVHSQAIICVLDWTLVQLGEPLCIAIIDRMLAIAEQFMTASHMRAMQLALPRQTEFAAVTLGRELTLVVRSSDS